MVKKLLKFFTFLLVIALIAMAMLYYALFVAVDHIQIRYETLASAKIPEELNDIKIAYFTDVEYGFYIDEEKFQKLINQIETTSPDVVIFGGDLFEDGEQEIKKETAEALSAGLKSVSAPLGKFAVLGERDLANETTRKTVTQILENAGFEILQNKSLHIRNKTKAGITLIGVDSLVNGEPNISEAVKQVTDEEFNILVTHCPDLFAQEIPYASISLGIAGHSHGSQINIPLYGPYQKVEGSAIYPLGKYSINGMELQVSSGVGTTQINARLFSPSEIVIYRLQHRD